MSLGEAIDVAEEALRTNTDVSQALTNVVTQLFASSNSHTYVGRILELILTTTNWPKTSTYNTRFLANFANNWSELVNPKVPWSTFSQALDFIEARGYMPDADNPTTTIPNNADVKTVIHMALNSPWVTKPDAIRTMASKTPVLYGDAARGLEFAVGYGIKDVNPLDAITDSKTACLIGRGMSVNHSVDGGTLANFVDPEDCTANVAGRFSSPPTLRSKTFFGSVSTGLMTPASDTLNHFKTPKWQRISGGLTSSSSVKRGTCSSKIVSGGECGALADVYDNLSTAAIHASYLKPIVIISAIVMPIILMIILFKVYKSFCTK